MNRAPIVFLATCLGCNSITGIDDYYVSADSALGVHQDADGSELPADSNEDSASTDSLYVLDVSDSSLDASPDGSGGDADSYTDVTDVVDTVVSSPVKRVFVSSESYYGNFGGLSSADAKCQALADAAKLGGTYKAWLSDSKVSAGSRLTHSAADYALVDGTLAAKGWVGLTSGSLLRKINVTETGSGSPSVCTWTHTKASGAAQPTAPCGDWAFATSAYGAGLGNIGYSDSMWTQWATLSCSYKCSFYCMEQ